MTTNCEKRPERNKHDRLNEVKEALAKTILARYSAPLIRAKSRSNLARWKSQGTWCSAYDEWQALIDEGDDEALVVAMSSKDEKYVRLRQSPPYVGLLDQATRLRVWEEVMSKNLYAPFDE